MIFTYYYKTPDGIRHEATVEAESHNAAFAALREMGIRPIKVLERRGDGRRAGIGMFRGTMVAILAAVVVALVAFLPVRERARRPESQRRPAQKVRRSAAFDALMARADALAADHVANVKAIEAQYSGTTKDGFLSERCAGCEEIRRAIEASRGRARDAFRDILETLPRDRADERLEAQLRYGELMDLFDADERRVLSEECALLFLHDNLDAWEVVGGEVVFSDAERGKEFELYRREDGISASRWQRDFGPRSGGVSSQIATLPDMPGDGE